MTIQWTPEADARLVELWPNHTARQVARIMGTSAGAVHQRVYALGLRREVTRKDNIPVGIRLPRELREAIRAEEQATGEAISAIIARVLYRHFKIDPPKGYNPWKNNGGARKNSGRKQRLESSRVFTPPHQPSLPPVSIGRD